MINVPSTVPSKPPAFIASNRQMMRAEAARKMAIKSTGAHGPVFSIACIHEFNPRSKASELPISK